MLRRGLPMLPLRRVMLVLVGAMAAAACGDSAREKAHAADVAAFDQVWTTVRDRHFDPTMGGLDWEAVRTELRPKVLAAKNRAEARAIMRDMIGRLELSHFAIIETGDDQGDDRPDTDGTFGMVGLDVRSVDGEILVTEVEPDGPADLAGVKLGWRIDAIGGKPVDEFLASVRAKHGDAPSLAAEEYGVVLDALIGSTREPIELGFGDGAGGHVTRRLEREDASDRIATYGNVAGIVIYESRRLGEHRDVGYLRVGAFLDPATVMKRYRTDLAGMADTRGVIIDLRGNLGGLGPMASGMTGMLVRREVVLGTTRSRESEQRYVANPQPGAYDGPVAVLVDELSMSTSEIFAAGIQDLGRGRVIGRRTPGVALPSAIEALPNGDKFQYAVSNYVTSKGRTIEGNGVEPDEIVALERSALLAGRDAPLEAALAWIDRPATQPEEPTP